MNIYRNFAIVIAGAALSSVLMEANPVQAAILTSDFIVDITSGSLGGTQAAGSVTFNDSSLTGTGLEAVTGDDLSISFDFQGENYTEADEAAPSDPEFGEYPRASFQDGEFLGINLLVTNQGSGSFGFGFSDEETADPDFASIGVNGGDAFYYFAANSEEDVIPEGQGVVSYSKPVPEPSSVLGTVAFGLVGTGLLIKRNMKKKAANKTLTL